MMIKKGDEVKFFDTDAGGWRMGTIEYLNSGSSTCGVKVAPDKVVSVPTWKLSQIDSYFYEAEGDDDA